MYKLNRLLPQTFQIDKFLDNEIPLIQQLISDIIWVVRIPLVAKSKYDMNNLKCKSLSIA